jgi:putative flippase GtrA
MTDGIGSRDAAAGVPRARHWLGFLFSGVLAFTVDWLCMEAGVRLLGLPPLVARLAGVACAMVVAWLAHRTLTFALTMTPSIGEFARYVAAASTTAMINYSVFALLIIIRPVTSRFAALVIASIIATIFSYLSMRYAVFRRSGG